MNVKEFLSSQHVPYEVVEHPSTYGAQRLASVLHIPGKNVAKTVLLRANHNYRGVVAVLPASASVDLEKVSKALGGSAVELANEQEVAEHCPECELGVLPPFGSLYEMITMVDESLSHDDEITFEGNSHSEAIRMKYADFKALESPLVVSFSCKASASQ